MKLRKITQAEFDNPAIVTKGLHKFSLYPCGDYTEVHIRPRKRMQFPDGCVFGNDAKFGMLACFGNNCVFGEFAEFGSGSTFGNKCTFKHRSAFGDNCEFGNDCIFDDMAEFDHSAQFGNACKFGDYSRFGNNWYGLGLDPKIQFGNTCTFGEYNVFEDACVFGKGNKFKNYNIFGANCRFGEKSEIGAQCTFSCGVAFSRNISMENGVIKNAKYASVTNIGPQNETMQMFYARDTKKLYIRIGSLFGDVDMVETLKMARISNEDLKAEWKAAFAYARARAIGVK